MKTKLIIIAFMTIGLVLLFAGAGIYNSGEYGEEGQHTGKDMMLCRWVAYIYHMIYYVLYVCSTHTYTPLHWPLHTLTLTPLYCPIHTLYTHTHAHTHCP